MITRFRYDLWAELWRHHEAFSAWSRRVRCAELQADTQVMAMLRELHPNVKLWENEATPWALNLLLECKRALDAAKRVLGIEETK